MLPQPHSQEENPSSLLDEAGNSSPGEGEVAHSQELEFCSNAEALAAIESSSDDSSIIVDFDETLFLRNSTEEYLNSIQPRLLGAILLFALSFLKPWKFLPESLGGESSRDWVRVLVATLLFPWTIVLWRRNARECAEKYVNSSLLEGLRKKEGAKVIVATNGFEFIIQPILASMDLPVESLIACRFWVGGKDRKLGKKALLANSLNDLELEKAICITDSKDDLPLLQAVAKPCLTLWPEAQYFKAMGDIYIPFFYTERVKQPGEKYTLKVILAEDLFFVILATSWLAPNPLVHVAGLTCLMASFWCIYEVGYMENDLVAETLEKDPKLSETYLDNKSRIDLRQPWFWSIAFSLPGIALVQMSDKALSGWNVAYWFDSFSLMGIGEGIVLLGRWVAMLIALRLTFLLYNRVNKPTRVWLYPFLQFFKCFGFLTITATNIVGIVLFVAQSLSRWMLYIIYRYSDGGWNKIGQVMRCLMFGFLAIVFAWGMGDSKILLSWQAIVILAYAALKARREFLSVVGKFGWL